MALQPTPTYTLLTPFWVFFVCFFFIFFGLLINILQPAGSLSSRESSATDTKKKNPSKLSEFATGAF